MTPKRMQRLEDLARRRIVAWLDAKLITQAKLAAEVGVSQTWVSQYKSGDQDADVDQLDAMARAFGHTIMELLELRPDPHERELVESYRALPAEKRPLAIQMVQAMGGALKPPPPRKRQP